MSNGVGVVIERCVCGRTKGDQVHAYKRPPPWWARLVLLAWPRWVWGQHAGVHEFMGVSELGLARNKLRALRRELDRAKRRASK
jgi:F420-0:gamma-glutamyl ligase-like protein